MRHPPDRNAAIKTKPNSDVEAKCPTRCSNSFFVGEEGWQAVRITWERLSHPPAGEWVDWDHLWLDTWQMKMASAQGR